MAARKQDPQERRQSIRHPISLPFEYQVVKKRSCLSQKSTKGKSRTLNISRGGLLFATREVLTKNAVLKIKIPFRNKVYTVHAKVVHCTKDSRENHYLVGVNFQDVSDAFRVRLIEQMYLIGEYWQLRKQQLGREISLPEASREWLRRYSQKFQKLYW
ncbi:MAG: PilZ domain-containing protein [Candidatus Omnitrophica bacterium]|nr:PilZ domain-containing protein [Candidatus Omnitrophota bacterium]